MPPMLQLAFWATLTLVCSFFYARYWHKLLASKYPKKCGIDSYGIGQTFIFLAWLVFIIFLMGFLSGTLRPGNPSEVGESASSNTKLSQTTLIILLAWGLLTIFSVYKSLRIFLLQWQNQTLAIVVGIVSTIALGLLMPMQVLDRQEWANNVYMILIFITLSPIAFASKRSGLLIIFSFIILLDIYLVWISQRGIATTQGNWYVSMISSNLIQHLPLPIAFYAGDHLIGGGDIFFMTLVIIFIQRFLNGKLAILMGALMILPMIILPALRSWLPNLPHAWPYTIFIAPWGILLVLYSFWLKPVIILSQNSDQPNSLDKK